MLDAEQRLDEVHERGGEMRAVEHEARGARRTLSQPQFTRGPRHDREPERQHARERTARREALDPPRPQEQHGGQRQRGLLAQHRGRIREHRRAGATATEQRQGPEHADEREQVLRARHPAEDDALQRQRGEEQQADEGGGREHAAARRREYGEQVGEQHERREERDELHDMERERATTGGQADDAEPRLTRQRSEVVAEAAGMQHRIEEAVASHLLEEQVVVIDEAEPERAGVQRGEGGEEQGRDLPTGARSDEVHDANLMEAGARGTPERVRGPAGSGFERGAQPRGRSGR
jgi:hypothetical protein